MPLGQINFTSNFINFMSDNLLRPIDTAPQPQLDRESQPTPIPQRNFWLAMGAQFALLATVADFRCLFCIQFRDWVRSAAFVNYHTHDQPCKKLLNHW
jgi:hypothetical protein